MAPPTSASRGCPRPHTRELPALVHSGPVSTLALVLIAVGAVLLVLFLGGVLYTILRERRTRDLDAHRIAEADRALATARATDRGWDRAFLEQAAHAALAQERPG